MKKFALIGLILSLGVSSFAKDKEIITQPVVEEEIIVQEVTATPVTLETTNENTIKENIKDNHIYFRVGGDIASRYSKYNVKGRSESFKFSNGKTKGLGYEIAIEGTQNITDSLELGVGIAYQGHNKNKDFTFEDAGESNTVKMAKYDSLPIYFTGKYNFKTESSWNPYIKANLGYAFNLNADKTKFTDNTGTQSIKTKVKNGLYTGIGAGVQYNNYLVDIMYQTNFAKAYLSDSQDGNSSKSKLNYSRVTLSVGYKLDI
ncbi:MAG: outer membrane beta-barrel protein [Cetobacterium sp.]|nr:outer membrane beta-barrel protein [Cetobacterium sp.]